MFVLLAALLSGAMFYFSQGLADIWALAWFAPVPLLWLAYGRAPTWQVAVASAMAILAGSAYALQCYATLPLMIIVVVVAPQVVLFPMAVVFARAVQRRGPALLVLIAFPATWTAFEYLVGVVSPHGTYGSLAYSQVSAPLLIQGASLFGYVAVTFALCLFANTLAMAIRAKRNSVAAIATGLAVCAINVAFGMVRLAHSQPQTVRVAAMVDETATGHAWHAKTLQDASAVVEAYAQAIRSAAAQGATFVVTAESAMPLMASWEPAIKAQLAEVSKQANVHIVAGFNQMEPAGDIALSFQPDAATQFYAKRHPVPILEDRFVPGTQSGWLGDGRAMEICKDMDFPATIRADAAKGVRLVGVPAGDFGLDAWLHARMAVMRSVEGGFAMVRAANDGLVTVNDAQGRLIASKMAAPTGLTSVVADVPLGSGPTIYIRIGDVFAWLCLAISLLTGVSLGRHWLQSRQDARSGRLSP
ncbi:apolipoprotein N-acyltransferase [Pinirhizobacter soli]|uniref:apolipoprotein N-acyltransferase n=1 Tax=Pinirhizobacter soli TaxID=2786953 RepID=UPI002029D903|nr:nitrilase-related carbon-nitrogen hydrolase [Pinirhizobacter soli]